MPDPRDNPLEWEGLVKANPTSWRTCVRKSMRDFGRGAKHFVDTAQGGGFKSLGDWSGRPAPTPSGDGAVFCCRECGCEFLSNAALKSHAMRKHAYIHPARRFADGSSCSACLKEFTSRVRLLHHLKYKSKRCLCAIMAFKTPIPHERRVELDSFDEKERQARHKMGKSACAAEIPVYVRSGPKLPGVIGPAAR